MLEIRHDDVYRDMLHYIEHLDTSDYETSHFLHSNERKKVVGKFKDEMNGKIILEFQGLSAKLYAFKIQGAKEKKAAKGVNRHVTKNISFADYHRVARDTTRHYEKMRRIRSNCHHLTIDLVNKIA